MESKTSKVFFSRFVKFFLIILFFIAIVVVAIYRFSAHYKVTLSKNSQENNNSLTSPTLKEQIGKFVILPTGYTLSENEKQLFIKASIKTVFFLDGSNEDTLKLSDMLEKDLTYKPQYYFVSEGSNYKECNNVSLTTNTNNKVEVVKYDLVKGECLPKNVITSVTSFVCKGAMKECEKDLLTYLHTKDTYLYIEASPFTQQFSQPSLIVEQKGGTVILTWPEVLPLNLTQKAYSLEYLDKDEKRISAYGLIEKPNQGDFFVPPRDYTNQTLSAKLRIWYKFKDETFSEPQIYTANFIYQKTKPPSIPLSTNTPLEIAWIPEWGMSEGIASVSKNPKKWHTISPTWYFPKKDGTLEYQSRTNNQQLVKILKANGIKLVPTSILFDEDILREILQKHMQKHVDELVNIAVSNGYDGFDIDYESTYIEDKELLTQFMTKLSYALHAKGKSVSFTAIPKIDDRKIYSSFPQTIQAQDWKAIGAVVDEFRIMAYDFTSQASKQAGPLSPLPWNESLILYALENMPASKVILALPIYSHAWPAASSNLVGINNDKSLNSGLKTNSLSWQHDDISYVKAHSSSYSESKNAWFGETYASFKYNGIQREMYFLSPQDVSKRLELAKRYGIKGLAYWRIGGDQL